MKRYEKKIRPAQEYESLVETLCDICRKPFTEGYGGVLETEVRMKTGYAHQDGGSGEETEFDICPGCFKEKLIPFLESLGAKPRVEDWDF